MAHVCLQADACRVFIKNGKLRFQARKTDDDENILEQITIGFPIEMTGWFAGVENLDATHQHRRVGDGHPRNRIQNFTENDS